LRSKDKESLQCCQAIGREVRILHHLQWLYRPLDWSTRYLRERWEGGERNGTVLWEELKTQGYTGSSRSVYRPLATWRDHSRKLGLSTSPGSVPRSPFEDVTKGAGHRVDGGPSRVSEPSGTAATGSDHADGWRSRSGTKADAGLLGTHSPTRCATRCVVFSLIDLCFSSSCP
jgi:hypothetical protein